MLSSTVQQCDCYKIIEPNYPHQCNICKRNFSACLYINELQHKITLQAIEIDQLKSEVKSCELEIRHQRLDIQTLNSKYVAGIEHVADIQHQKDLADRELEELCTRLFEEANNMVVSEKRKKHQLEQLLRYTEDQLSTEQSQLYELRNRIENTAAFSPPPPSYFDDFKRPMSDMMQHFHKSDSGILHHNSIENTINSRMLFNQIKAQQNIILSKQNDDETKTADDGNQQVGLVPDRDSFLNNNNNNSSSSSTTTNKNAGGLFGDNHEDGGLQLDLFRKFIEQEQKKRRNSSPSLISSSSSNDEDDDEEEETYSFFQYIQQHQQSEYITRCEIEDIEPCLQFGNSNSRMCVKLMMEYMSQAPCFIEPITTEEAKLIPSPFSAVTTVYYRPIWERLTAASVSPQQQQQQLQLECSACGKRRDTTKSCYYYRFRLDENEDWLLIDQNCRDRLVAVCNFYSFIRNIQMDYYNHRLPDDLYLENVQLRLKMFYSR